MLDPKIIVGIDPGAQTGYAEWDVANGKLVDVDTLYMAMAQKRITSLYDIGALARVVFEDARLRKGGFGAMDAAEEKHGAGVREGVGAIKAECRLWQDWLELYGIQYTAVAPAQAATKWEAATFRAATGWTTRTSQHGRDAALLVFGSGRAQTLADIGKAATTPGKALPQPAGACKHCSHPVADHLPGTNRCPRGVKHQTLGFTAYANTKFEPA